ncbi:hypothetical protein BsWGS_07815 [Bradybaena similaris]
MKIRVDNISDRESVAYPLPLLIGDVEGYQQDGCILVTSSGDPDGAIDWPIVDGYFKVLVRLQPGENIINLRCNQESLTMRLTYDLPGFTHIVRPVYIVCADDDGYFQGPENIDCSPTSARKRIAFGAQVIQTLTAEKMNEHGFGRITFEVETDYENMPVCHEFKSKLTLGEAYSMTGYELWSFFGKELMTSPMFSHKSQSKFYCFMSFTRYHLPKDEDLPKTHSDILKHTKGHTALGGGGLALFGTGNLHTWAEGLATFNSCLTNRTKIDRRKFMDDSAYRQYYWANYATGLGASLHELGHTFDLAHTPSGIMARGFDDLHKVFTVQRRRKGRHHQRSSGSQRQRYSSSGSSNSEMSRTPSASSVDDSSSSLGSSSDFSGSASAQSAGVVTQNAVLRRQTDVCYGSPYKQTPVTCEKAYITPPPLLVSVESGFRQTTAPTTLTLSVKNYDGSESQHTIVEGERDHAVPGNTNTNSIARLSEGGSSSSHSPTFVAPSTLPNSPEEMSSTSEVTLKPEVAFVDAGAHWHRSSAVVLRFHKWFHKVSTEETRKMVSLQGTRVQSHLGLRVVELRTDPEGLVFQHWEFLGHTPPTEFTLQRSKISSLPDDSTTVTVMAEDNSGNILKKRIHVEDFV